VGSISAFGSGRTAGLDEDRQAALGYSQGMVEACQARYPLLEFHMI
jgi:hypothetical protein